MGIVYYAQRKLDHMCAGLQNETRISKNIGTQIANKMHKAHVQEYTHTPHASTYDL